MKDFVSLKAVQDVKLARRRSRGFFSPFARVILLEEGESQKGGSGERERGLLKLRRTVTFQRTMPKGNQGQVSGKGVRAALETQGQSPRAKGIWQRTKRVALISHTGFNASTLDSVSCGEMRSQRFPSRSRHGCDQCGGILNIVQVRLVVSETVFALSHSFGSTITMCWHRWTSNSSWSGAEAFLEQL